MILGDDIAAEDRVYDEIYYVGHAVADQQLLSVRNANGGTDYITPVDLYSFKSMAQIGHLRAAAILGCAAGRSGFATVLGRAMNEPVLASLVNIDRTVTFEQSGVSDQIKSIQFAGLSLEIFP